MKPARWMRPSALEERLLRVDAGSGALEDLRVGDLARLFAPGDLLVVNDAATLPASLHGRREGGEPIELRLVEAPSHGRARAVLFGEGDWTLPTENRPAPAPPRIRERFELGDGLAATVTAIGEHPRLLELSFSPDGDALWRALYARGHAVQYSYLERPLELWAVQSVFAARPWSVEMPSAGRPLRWEVLLALRRRGVRIARLTHAAGLSSTGDAELDRLLPLSERCEVPEATARELAETRARGGRVIAVGTTVVRALETAAREDGSVAPGEHLATLRLGPGYRLRVVDGLLTGMHEPGTSHFALLRAFAPEEVLLRADAHAESEGYLCHEFGDSMLLLRGGLGRS